MPERLGVARQIRQISRLSHDFGLVHLLARKHEKANRPAVGAAPLRGDQAQAVDLSDVRRAPDGMFGRLDWEWVTRTAAVPVEVNPSGVILVEKR
jgi:hypothetical protein